MLHRLSESGTKHECQHEWTARPQASARPPAPADQTSCTAVRPYPPVCIRTVSVARASPPGRQHAPPISDAVPTSVLLVPARVDCTATGTRQAPCTSRSDFLHCSTALLARMHPYRIGGPRQPVGMPTCTFHLLDSVPQYLPCDSTNRQYSHRNQTSLLYRPDNLLHTSVVELPNMDPHLSGSRRLAMTPAGNSTSAWCSLSALNNTEEHTAMADSEYLGGSVTPSSQLSVTTPQPLHTNLRSLHTTLFFFSSSSHSCIEPDRCGARRARQLQETEHGSPFPMQSRGANLIGYDLPDLATISITGETATRPAIGALGFKRAL